MGDWRELIFEDLIEDKLIGLVRNTKQQSNDFEFDYLKMNNITNDGNLDLSDLVKVNASTDEIEKYKLKKGDFLFNTRNSVELVGKTAIYDFELSKPILFNNNIMRSRFKSDFDPYFINYQFQSSKFQEKLEKIKSGTTSVAAIYYKSLRDIKLKFPPLPEQQRIVSKLDGLFEKIDKAINLLEENIAHTEALMGSVLDDEFKKGEEKGWPLLKFTEFASLRHGHQFRKYDFVENGIPVVKIGQCKKDGSLDLSNCNFIDQSRLAEFQEDRIYKDDLLMALTGGTLGKVTWVESDYGDLVQNYRVGNFFSIEGKSIKRFLMYILMSSIFQKLVEAKVNQGAQPNIGKENIDNMIVPIPSIKKQEVLIEKFDVIMRNQAKIIETQSDKLNHLKALKSSLLDQAFKGEL